VQRNKRSDFHSRDSTLLFLIVHEGNCFPSSSKGHVSTREFIKEFYSTLCYRKQLQFSLLNPQDVVKLSEFQVTHRDLYTAADRLPVKDGVLDRRLVSFLLLHTFFRHSSLSPRVLQRRARSVRPAG
jgi:hypothetical protein